MIYELLDVSRILRDKLVLNIAPEDALETVQSVAIAKAIQIQTQFDDTPIQTLGDSNRLKHLIWNLLSNAVKFMPLEGKVTIQLSCVDSLTLLQSIEALLSTWMSLLDQSAVS